MELGSLPFNVVIVLEGGRREEEREEDAVSRMGRMGRVKGQLTRRKFEMVGGWVGGWRMENRVGIGVGSRI